MTSPDEDPGLRLKVDLHTVPDAAPKSAFRARMDVILRFVQLLPLFGGLVSATTYFVYDSQSKSHQLELEQQELSLHRLELQEKVASRIEVSSSLAVSCPEGESYPPCQARFTMRFPNRGLAQMRIAQNVVSVYHGKIPETRAEVDGGALAVRLPGDVGGLVSWGKPVAEARYGGSLGGGNTGLVLPGEETVSTYDYALFADAGDWVAVRAILEVQSVAEDGGGSIDDHAGRNEIVDKYCRVGGNDLWSCPRGEPTNERDGG